MTDATMKLLTVVSEVGGEPWDASPGLTEGLLPVWLGEKEDLGDDLREKVDRKPEELARLAEVAEANFLGPVGADLVAPQFFGSTRPGEATQEWREGSKRVATAGLFTQVHIAIKRKIDAGGRKERPGRRC